MRVAKWKSVARWLTASVVTTLIRLIYSIGYLFPGFVLGALLSSYFELARNTVLNELTVINRVPALHKVA